VKIVDPQPSDPQSSDDGPASGEIAIRGPNVMLGYYNRQMLPQRRSEMAGC